MIRVRLATLEDVTDVIPRTQALDAEEGIVIDDVSLEAAVRLRSRVRGVAVLDV